MIDEKEQHLEEVYQTICKSPEVARAIAGLHDNTLRELNGWLDRLAAETGIPALVADLVGEEGRKRFFAQKS